LEYNLSAKLVAKRLDLELEEVPDWSCCGASAAHNTNHKLAVALSARNLALAEKQGLDLAVPCAACFSRLKAAQKAMDGSPKVKGEMEEIIELPYQGTSRVYNLLDIMVNHVGTEAIAEKVVQPLEGLKVACYYGCLLLRPPAVTGFDDSENPETMEKLVAALGGEPISWAFKSECCGAGHTTTRPDVSGVMLNRIYQDAQKRGADCLISACPLCMLNLDMREVEVGRSFGKEYHLPVFYFTELIGLALGCSPRELGLSKHFVSPLPLLDAKEIIKPQEARREEA